MSQNKLFKPRLLRHDTTHQSTPSPGRPWIPRRNKSISSLTQTALYVMIYSLSPDGFLPVGTIPFHPATTFAAPTLRRPPSPRPYAPCARRVGAGSRAGGFPNGHATTEPREHPSGSPKNPWKNSRRALILWYFAGSVNLSLDPFSLLLSPSPSLSALASTTTGLNSHTWLSLPPHTASQHSAILRRTVQDIEAEGASMSKRSWRRIFRPLRVPRQPWQRWACGVCCDNLY